MKWTIREYLTSDGKNPYRNWLDTLDVSVRARIQARVLCFETGNLRDHRSMGGCVWEARLPFGLGYRIYFGTGRTTLLLLLVEGDKASHRNDIRRALRFWAEYGEARHGKAE